MKNKNENKIILKQWIQVFMIIIVLIMMAFSIWAIFKSISPKHAGGEELYSYNYNNNLSYKVYIKQNQFYTMPYMGMNKQYITSLIDHIDVNTKYSFQSTKDLEYTYTYDMVATAKAIFAEADGKANEVWSKSYPILPSETKTGNGKVINIDKTIAVDYNKYNSILADFRNQFGLSVDARVDITFKVTVTGGLPGQDKTLEESNSMNLIIPLLKTTTQLKPDYVNSGSQKVTSAVTDDNDINIPLLIFGIILLLFTLFMLKIYGSRLLVATKKSEYILQLNKILKEYGDIIAESDNLPDLFKYDVVSIKQFNDLVDIEEELHSPILCNEIRENLETLFIILYDKTAYIYILKYEDFGHIINDKKLK